MASLKTKLFLPSSREAAGEKSRMETNIGLLEDCSPFRISAKENYLGGWISSLGLPCHLETNHNLSNWIGLTSFCIHLNSPLSLRVCPIISLDISKFNL